ncbi:copper chaperone PCu(A)C [Brevundimonas sp. SORGH_AS_0993]|uniref:copper chaperone PCu(A)C n=1 Tax=Brevundimonas sp. SORGH_AS_0993 TaxID=3041794 RepID=UPI00277D62FB|nr:copper chaperone PCu(A)C [Brevundimonas sp. SORGH_AS_0993]MDQ1152930.1 copper(I)-binding protein [Brevundimonas sp. SORGH_AS_0993]
MKPPFPLAALTLTLAACGQPGQKAETSKVATVAVTDAWCRPTPNGAQAGACYATFLASTDDRLTGGSSPAADQVQTHEMSMADGVMHMGELKDGLPLPAGKAVTLAPGGAHLMLTGLAQPLVAGQTTPLTLRFASAPSVTVQAQIRMPSTGGAGMAHGGH